VGFFRIEKIGTTATHFPGRRQGARVSAASTRCCCAHSGMSTAWTWSPDALHGNRQRPMQPWCMTRLLRHGDSGAYDAASGELRLSALDILPLLSEPQARLRQSVRESSPRPVPEHDYKESSEQLHRDALFSTPTATELFDCQEHELGREGCCNSRVPSPRWQRYWLPSGSTRGAITPVHQPDHLPTI